MSGPELCISYGKNDLLILPLQCVYWTFEHGIFLAVPENFVSNAPNFFEWIFQRLFSYLTSVQTLNSFFKLDWFNLTLLFCQQRINGTYILQIHNNTRIQSNDGENVLSISYLSILRSQDAIFKLNAVIVDWIRFRLTRLAELFC